MERQGRAEAAVGTGLTEYRLLLDALSGVESYQAAVAVFEEGAYFTRPSDHVFRPPKLPEGYTSVALSLTRDDGSRIMVGVPFRRDERIGLANALQTARIVRVGELEEYAAHFNGLSLHDRRSKIQAHLHAKATLQRGIRELQPSTLKRLRTDLFPGPFVIDTDAFLLRAVN